MENVDDINSLSRESCQVIACIRAAILIVAKLE